MPVTYLATKSPDPRKKEVMPADMLIKPLDGTRLKKLSDFSTCLILEQTCYVLKFHDLFPHIGENLNTFKFVSFSF